MKRCGKHGSRRAVCKTGGAAPRARPPQSGSRSRGCLLRLDLWSLETPYAVVVGFIAAASAILMTNTAAKTQCLA